MHSYQGLDTFPPHTHVASRLAARRGDVAQVGERLGFGATMLLSIQLLMLIVADITPKCGEMLWVDIFNWVNFGFACVAIVESVVVIFIAFGGVGTVDEVAAEKVDYWARRLIPSLYACVQGVVYSMHLDDGYLGHWDKTMFQGAPANITFNTAIALILPLTFAGAGVLKCALSRSLRSQRCRRLGERWIPKQVARAAKGGRRSVEHGVSATADAVADNLFEVVGRPDYVGEETTPVRADSRNMLHDIAEQMQQLAQITANIQQQQQMQQAPPCNEPRPTIRVEHVQVEHA